MDLKEALKACRRPNAKAFIIKQNITDLSKQGSSSVAEIVTVEYDKVITDNNLSLEESCNGETTD